MSIGNELGIVLFIIAIIGVIALFLYRGKESIDYSKEMVDDDFVKIDMSKMEASYYPLHPNQRLKVDTSSMTREELIKEALELYSPKELQYIIGYKRLKTVKNFIKDPSRMTKRVETLLREIVD